MNFTNRGKKEQLWHVVISQYLETLPTAEQALKHGGGDARLWQPVAQEMFFFYRQKEQWASTKYWQILANI